MRAARAARRRARLLAFALATASAHAQDAPPPTRGRRCDQLEAPSARHRRGLAVGRGDDHRIRLADVQPLRGVPRAGMAALLKAKYVDAGKVKFILREFPLDPLATAAFMAARCAGPDKRDALIDRLFAQQKAGRSWTSRSNVCCRRGGHVADRFPGLREGQGRCTNSSTQAGICRDAIRPRFDADVFRQRTKLTGEPAIGDSTSSWRRC